MEKYRKIERIGEGAHGVVYRAEVLPQYHDIVTHHHSQLVQQSHLPQSQLQQAKQWDEDEQKQAPTESDKPASIHVAIKKIRIRSSKEGLSMEAIREIKLLQEVNSPYIVSIYDIFMQEANIHLVLEHMQYDLESLIRNTQQIVLTAADIKAYMLQICRSMVCIHEQYIMHRDLKPGNFLVAHNHALKLSDFGLARTYGSPDRQHSPQACTLWYRAPELLYGSRCYTAAADMWSIGCIFGELMWRKPLFVADRDKELSQLQVIFAVLGTPSSDSWPNSKYLPNYIDFQPQAGRPFNELFPAATDDAVDLIRQMLKFDPAQRITARQALEHRYFTSAPKPTPIEKLPKVSKGTANN